MVRQIIQIGDVRLTQKSEPLSKNDISLPENQQLFRDLIDTCDAERDGTAGLSAVQVGVLKRVYVVRRLDHDAGDDDLALWQVMINPEVKVVGTAESTIWEGCMSVGEGKERLFGPVSRPDKVKATYLTTEGNKVTETLTGYMAHIIQHEQDHINGILFLRYISNPANIWPSAKLDKYLDKYGDFPPVLN